MPVRASNDVPVRGHFKSLAELDAWVNVPHQQLSSALPFKPRPAIKSQRGKLLVCHDYKNGHVDGPCTLAYTFNFWSLCDTFVYFTHDRVTIPPTGWITAAHRQGVPMLGTLIFEGDAEADCLRLIRGGLPPSTTRPALPQISAGTPPSPHYAQVLADLAVQRRFDGYLLNFECRLAGGSEQARALAAWIMLLRTQLLEKVGPHAQVIWYDSVTSTGQLAWQDKLNSSNLPFFLPSTGFFTNYFWPYPYPRQSVDFFRSIPSDVLKKNASSVTGPLTVRDIYTGVDVWGRGCHGGGGLGCYRAIKHIDPPTLGLSVALFGQGWTWETMENTPGWNWDAWWARESTLWVGPADPKQIVSVPPMPPLRPGEHPPCSDGAFVPLVSFFEGRTPPDPARFPLHVSFCPGIGEAWFVQGMKVLQLEKGWTDMNKQTGLGDLLWPRPTLALEGADKQGPLPNASCALNKTDAWNSGSSVELAFIGSGSDMPSRLWLPVQSLSLTERQSYGATLVLKLPGSHIDIDVSLSVKQAKPGDPRPIVITPGAASRVDLPLGWMKLSTRFSVGTAASDGTPVRGSLGLVLSFKTTTSYKFSVLLGQINVFPSLSSAGGSPLSRILSVAFKPSSPTTSPPGTKKRLAGSLTWDVSMSSSQPTDDPLSQFLFFNVYFETSTTTSTTAMGPEKATFVGTSGYEDLANMFRVNPECLPDIPADTALARFYVQGTTDQGEVLGWERCAFVDVPMK